MVLNDGVRKVIVESIDTALGSFGYVDKETFYHTLESECGLKVEDIPVKYELFHNALSEIYGTGHFAVERKIVQILHERSKSGVYDEAHEIPAFAVLVNSYMAEVGRAVIKNKAQIKENFKTLAKIKKTQA